MERADTNELRALGLEPNLLGNHGHQISGSKHPVAIGLSTSRCHLESEPPALSLPCEREPASQDWKVPHKNHITSFMPNLDILLAQVPGILLHNNKLDLGGTQGLEPVLHPLPSGQEL